jgi:hypothetical protein
MIDNLDMFQSMVDNGSISPSSLNMNSEQQLNNFNFWLAQLTESIEQEGGGGSNTGELLVPQQSSNYADMLLQFNSNALPIQDDNLYPTSQQNNVEEDLYVRSHPMSQQTAVDYNNNNQSKLYGGDYLMDSHNYTNLTPNMTMDMPHMSGLRHHYTNVPGIVSNNGAFFTPDLRTSQNLHSSKDSVKYKPKSGQEKEEKAAEAFKPIKPTLIETKKNVTTMMNVFTSADGCSSKKLSVSSADETAKQSPAKKSPVNKDVLELLVSDMSELTIKKIEQKPKQDKPLYPTTATVSNDKLSKVEKHQKLLKQLSEWVNKNYAKNQPQSTTTIASRKQPSSVQVQ